MPSTEQPPLNYPRAGSDNRGFLMRALHSFNWAIERDYVTLFPQSQALWVFILLREDRRRFSEPVALTKKEIASRLGFRDEDSIDQYRDELLAKGWLHAQSSHRKTTRYWILIPEEFQQWDSFHADSESIDLNSRSAPSAIDLPAMPTADAIYAAATMIHDAVAPDNYVTRTRVYPRDYCPDTVLELATAAIRCGPKTLSGWLTSLELRKKRNALETTSLTYLTGCARHAAGGAGRFKELIRNRPTLSQEQMAAISKPVADSNCSNKPNVSQSGEELQKTLRSPSARRA